MTDVLFYQNYTYVADISAIVLCIICWLLLHSSYAVREKSLVIFKAGTVCLMMATVCGARAQGREKECGQSHGLQNPGRFLFMCCRMGYIFS